MKPLVAAVLALGLVACGSWPPWKPPTEPTPPPGPEPCTVGSCPRDIEAPTMCVEGECVPCEPDLSGVPWHTDIPTPHCSTEERPVKHWPADLECPVLTDPCEEPEPPSTSCVPPGEPPEPWGDPVPRSMRPPKMGTAIEKAKREVGEDCSRRPPETLRLVADALKADGHCADGPWGKTAGHGDAVAIKAPDGLFEEWHVVAFGNGCYTGNPYKGAWPWLGPDVPPVDPPPPGACGDPHPSECVSAKISLKKHGGPNSCRWDSTYQCTRSCDYCAEIGMGEHGGQIRCGCPVRPECGPDAPPDGICHEREACEAEVGMGPNQKWWCDGQPIESEENPAQARCCGTVRTSTEDGSVVAEATW